MLAILLVTLQVLSSAGLNLDTLAATWHISKNTVAGGERSNC